MSDALTIEPLTSWIRNEWMFDIHMRVAQTDIKKMPTQGYFETIEPEKRQREATIWQMLRADGTPATSPEESVLRMISRPAMKNPTSEEWAAKIEETYTEMERSQKRLQEYQKEVTAKKETTEADVIHPSEC